MTPQNKTREFTFQFLFHLQLPIFAEDKKNFENADKMELKKSFQAFKTSANLLLDDSAQEKVINRVYGIVTHYALLEEKISSHLKNWKLERLSKVDHTILLLATYELMHEKKTPKNVVINEAIELSKKYGTGESYAFINGVLDNLASSL